MASDTQASTRRPRGGRDGRRAGRAAHGAPAYITRRIPAYEMLSEEALVLVETHADRILEEVGFEIRGDQEAVDLFRAAGAKTDGFLIRPPRGLVRADHPALLPARIRPARPQSGPIGEDRRRCTRCSRPPMARPSSPISTRGRRYGTLEDFRNFVKLAYVTPWLHHSGGTVCEPVDVPVNKRHFDMVLRPHDAVRQGVHGLGDDRAARRRFDRDVPRACSAPTSSTSNCVILGNVNTNSPLVLDGEASRVIRTYARGQPGGGVRALHPRRRDGAGDDRRRPGAMLRRGDDVRGADPARAPGRAGDPRQLPVLDVAEVRRADLRHARAGARLPGDRAAGAPPRRAAALRRQSLRLQDPRRPGGL